MKYEKPITRKKLHIGCLNCSSASLKLSMDRILDVGFGDVHVTRDGEYVYDCTGYGYSIEKDGVMTEFKTDNYPIDGSANAWLIERMANKDPFHDWRIVFYGPMHGETYQRQGYMNWVCIESNKGFA